MSTYRIEWPCCGSVTETQGYEPDACPFCTNPAPSAPEGMVLVPTEPTDKMLEAAWELNLALEGIRQHCTNRYKAMLAVVRSE